MINCEWCFECCWPKIPCTQKEKQQINKYLKDNNLKAIEAKEWYCKYLNSQGKCMVYEVRPYICKMFGECGNPMMQCPKDKDQKNLSVEFEVWKSEWNRKRMWL